MERMGETVLLLVYWRHTKIGFSSFCFFFLMNLPGLVCIVLNTGEMDRF